MFKNKPWKEWKTRKATLVFSIFCICIYILIGVYMGLQDKVLDSTLTTEVFDFFKWLVITGCTITIAKVLKDKDVLEKQNESFFDIKNEEENYD